jgi:DNA-binding response OmpR family regulator
LTTVLVIEGEGALMRLLSWSLQEAGYDVMSLRPVQLAAPPPKTCDAVVLNLELEGEDRLQLLRRLRRLCSGAPVVDLSEPVRFAPEEMRADAYVAPPYRALAVTEAIEELLKR